ncbi:MAG: AAA family ATPase [Synechococcus sp.]
MRLLHCTLQNIRVHKTLELAFSPRLTVIGGANESGKSTLVEALHRTLFLKASATGATVEALQSRHHLGLPTVDLGFEARGTEWLLRKRFSGHSGQVSLQDRSGRSGLLKGPAAEDHLATLLGVDAILSSRQANKVLPGRWAHLWVMQGLAGDDPLAENRYDLDGLLEQLERHGGAVVQQSRLDQQLSQALDQALAEQFTSRGVKRHSPLWQLEQAAHAADTKLEQAQQQLSDFDEATTELTKLSQEFHHLDTTLIPDLSRQRQDQQQQLERISTLKSQHDLAIKALEPIRLRHQRTSERLQRQVVVHQEIEQRQSRLDQLKTRLASAAPKQRHLETNVAELSEQRRQGDEALQALEQASVELQQRIQRLQLDHDADRNRRDLSQLKELAQHHQRLCQTRDALPKIESAQLDALRKLNRDIQEATIRCSAMAAGLTVVTSDQTISLNGQPLAVGEERIIDEPAELQVGANVQLSIKPNGGEALSSLKQSIQSKTALLLSNLKALDLDDLEAAERVVSERQRLEQSLQAISPPSATQIQTLEQRDQTLQAQIALLPPFQPSDRPAPAATDPAMLRVEFDKRQRDLQATRTKQRSLERHLETTQRELQQHRREQDDAETESNLLQKDLTERQHILSDLVNEHGDLACQRTEQSEQQAALRQAEQVASQFSEQLNALDADRLLAQTTAIARQLEALQQRREDLIDRRGRAKERCDQISASDPYDRLAEAEAQAINARDELTQFRQRIKAQKLLQDLFRSAQNDLSQRYSQPLGDAVNDLLATVVGEGSTSRLTFQQSSGFQGLQLCRGTGVYDFGELSGGMREQLTAAVRLAMADVLRPGHDGCLPLVFDDAFTNSDPGRIQRLTAMLSQAADRGLQIIVLSCDPTPYTAIADVVYQLPAQTGMVEP